jgi:hypothetical protein
MGRAIRSLVERMHVALLCAIQPALWREYRDATRSAQSALREFHRAGRRDGGARVNACIGAAGGDQSRSDSAQYCSAAGAPVAACRPARTRVSRDHSRRQWHSSAGHAIFRAPDSIGYVDRACRAADCDCTCRST